MSNTTEQSGVSLVFTDHDQNYYVIPVEVFEGGRVPAEHKVEVEEAMHEHEVTGYHPLVVAGGFVLLGSGLVASGMMIGAGLTYGGIAAGKALRAYTDEANNSSTPIGDGDTPVVYREG
jgi:hypothetical protein